MPATGNSTAPSPVIGSERVIFNRAITWSRLSTSTRSGLRLARSSPTSRRPLLAPPEKSPKTARRKGPLGGILAEAAPSLMMPKLSSMLVLPAAPWGALKCLERRHSGESRNPSLDKRAIGEMDPGFRRGDAAKGIQCLAAEIVLERIVLGPDVEARHVRPRHHAVQELVADRRQHGVGQDRVDHAPAALELGAAAGDELHHRIVIAEGDLPRLLDALLDARELQANDV